MVQGVSKYDPLAGPKLGEKTELLYCWANIDVKQANFEKIKPKIEKSRCDVKVPQMKTKIELNQIGNNKINFLQGLLSSSSSDEDSVEPLVTFTQEVR